LHNSENFIYHGTNGLQRMHSVVLEGQQLELDLSMALDNYESLTEYLMEEVCSPKNLNQAYKRVKANKGAAGVDGMTVQELGGYISQHKETLIKSLLDGSYKPQAVRAVEIPKPDGGIRQLGILTVAS